MKEDKRGRRREGGRERKVGYSISKRGGNTKVRQKEKRKERSWKGESRIKRKRERAAGREREYNMQGWQA